MPRCGAQRDDCLDDGRHLASRVEMARLAVVMIWTAYYWTSHVWLPGSQSTVLSFLMAAIVKNVSGATHLSVSSTT